MNKAARHWPLLVGAVSAWTIGITLATTTEARSGALEALLVVGSVLVGAWIAMLARSGYDGRRDDEVGE